MQQARDVSSAPLVEKVVYERPIPLTLKDSHLQSPELHILSVPATERLYGVTGVYLTEKRNGTLAYVGHVTYSWPKDAPQEAGVSVNMLKANSFREKMTQVPPEIAALTQNGDLFHAVEIGEAYRSRHLGESLWLAATKVMHDRGVTSVLVSGDVTIGKKDATSSFYGKYGAVPDALGRSVMNVSETVAKFGDLIGQMFVR